jgi:predicted nucleotidyltransferase
MLSAILETMTRSEAIARLKASEPQLRSRGVKSLAIFGSTSRGEAGGASDVDLLIELDEKRVVTLFDLSDLKFLASEVLGEPVDIAIRGQLRPGYRDTIEAEAVRVF